jgi:fatty-acyl-CoA synthase
MPDVAPFTPDTAAAIARARQHGVGDLLRRTALRYPDKLAVVSGERRFTYAEFDAAVNRAANALAARGVTKGDRLALLSRNCWEYAVVAFATAKLGVVLVPVNFMLGAGEVAYILRHSGASGMVAGAELVDTAKRALAEAGVTGGVRGRIGGAAEGWEDVADWWTAGPAHDPEVAVADDTRCGSCTPRAPSHGRRA